MSYTSWKRKLVPGTQLSLINIRRPWRSRKVVVHEMTKRYLYVRDKGYSGSSLTTIEMTPAAFTRVIDDDTVAFLADRDGPSWTAPDVPTKDGILAGMPWLRVKVLS